jgi:hypothetical protein
MHYQTQAEKEKLVDKLVQQLADPMLALWNIYTFATREFKQPVRQRRQWLNSLYRNEAALSRFRHMLDRITMDGNCSPTYYSQTTKRSKNS